MKMITPANGVEIDVPESSVEHFKACGYTPAKSAAKPDSNGEKAPKKPRKKE